MSIVIRKASDIQAHEKPTHVLNREYYGDYPMRVHLERYPDGSVTVDAPIELSEADILAIDWNKNTWGYELTYPNGVTTGRGVDTPRDYNEENPFAHLLSDKE